MSRIGIPAGKPEGQSGIDGGDLPALLAYRPALAVKRTTVPLEMPVTYS